MGSREKAFDSARPGTRRGAARTRSPWIWIVAAIGIVAAVLIAAGGIWAVKRGSDEGAKAPVVSGQPVPEMSGRQAPGFTLMSATGAPTNYTPYTFTPGDGKTHLFVFFMGYF